MLRPCVGVDGIHVNQILDGLMIILPLLVDLFNSVILICKYPVC